MTLSHLGNVYKGLNRAQKAILIVGLLLLFATVYALVCPPKALAADFVTVTVSANPPAAGTWTASFLSINTPTGKLSGFVNISVSGTWVGTVTLQRSFDSGTTWTDVTTTTSNMQRALIDQESGVRYRIGVKNVQYTSGSVVLRLSR